MRRRFAIHADRNGSYLTFRDNGIEVMVAMAEHLAPELNLKPGQMVSVDVKVLKAPEKFPAPDSLEIDVGWGVDLRLHDYSRTAHVYINAHNRKTFGVQLRGSFIGQFHRDETWLGAEWPTAELALAVAYRWVRHGKKAQPVYRSNQPIPSFLPGEKTWLKHHADLVSTLNSRRA